MLRGSSSHGHMNASGACEAKRSARSWSALGSWRRTRAEAAMRQRSARCRCEASRSMAPSATRLAEGMDARARERSPAHLHDESVDDRAGRDDFPPERLATLDGEPVQVALTGERDGALRERSQQPAIGRIARKSVPWADVDVRAEPLETGEDDRVRVRRDEDAQVRPGRPRRPPPRRARRSRSSPRQAPAAATVGARPIRSATSSCRARRRDVAPCASRRRCPSRPSSRPRRLREPEGVAQPGAPRERRYREAVPVDRGDRAVELRTSSQKAWSESPPARARWYAWRSCGSGRTDWAPRRLGEADGREVELASQHVVDVVAHDPRSGSGTGSGIARDPARRRSRRRRVVRRAAHNDSRRLSGR